MINVWLWMPQHLREVALLINQSQQIAGFPGQQVQDVLIVAEADVVPHNILLHVLLLLQLEDMAHKELLQLLVGVVDAQLLKAMKKIPQKTLFVHNS